MLVLEAGDGFKVFRFFLVRIHIFHQLVTATPNIDSGSTLLTVVLLPWPAVVAKTARSLPPS